MGLKGSTKPIGYFLSQKKFLSYLQKEKILAKDAAIRYVDLPGEPKEVWACYARWQEGSEMELAGFSDAEDRQPAFPIKPDHYTMAKLERMSESDNPYNIDAVVSEIKDYTYKAPPSPWSFLWDIPPYVAISIFLILVIGMGMLVKNVFGERQSVGYDLRLDPSSAEVHSLRFPQQIKEVIYYVSPKRVVFEGNISPSVVESMINHPSRVIKPPQEPITVMKPRAFDPDTGGVFVQYVAYGLAWEFPDGVVVFDMETNRIYGDVSRTTFQEIVN